MNGLVLPPGTRAGAARRDGIFGYFGKATNVTDGRYVYFRNPVNDDAGPLYEYTAMPTVVNLTGITAGAGESQNLTVTATSDNQSLVANPAVTYTSPNAAGTLSFVARSSSRNSSSAMIATSWSRTAPGRVPSARSLRSGCTPRCRSRPI